MQRLKIAKNLNIRQAMLVENAYYICRPPDRPAIEKKERTPLQLYIRHLIHDELVQDDIKQVRCYSAHTAWICFKKVPVCQAIELQYDQVPKTFNHELQPCAADSAAAAIAVSCPEVALAWISIWSNCSLSLSLALKQLLAEQDTPILSIVIGMPGSASTGCSNSSASLLAPANTVLHWGTDSAFASALSQKWQCSSWNQADECWVLLK